MTSKKNSMCPEAIKCEDKGRVVFSTLYLIEENLATHYYHELLISAEDMRIVVQVQ